MNPCSPTRRDASKSSLSQSRIAGGLRVALAMLTLVSTVVAEPVAYELFDAPAMNAPMDCGNNGNIGCTPGCTQPQRLPPVAHSHFQPSVLRFSLFPPPPVGECPKFFSATPHCLTNDPRSCLTPACEADFSPDPCYDYKPYDACGEVDIYGNRPPVAVQRPLVEWGLPFYDRGPIPVSQTWCGETNLVQQKFYVYGDYRVGLGQNKNLNNESTVLAHRFNLDLDYWMTGTERLHMFVSPFQENGQFMRVEEGEFFEELELFNDNTDTLFFEGDLGQMLGGWEGTYAPFDLPVTAGLIPLLFQNGVWAQDAFWGAAVSVPALNNPWLDWSNYDITLFAGFDQVSSDAFDQANSSAHVYGATTFIEARGGYFELGYGYLDDRHGVGRSYHNIAMSYTRRYANLISNSVRVIVNTGQNGPQADRTADGVLLLVENSFLTKNPYHVIPYVNFFAGFDRPQPLARAAAFGGVLFNTGILFQTDALTGFPTLDPTGNNTAGVAVGLDLLGKPDFDQQLIIEAAMLQAFGDAAGRNAPGNQYGVGVRWQLPITNATLIRADAMYGFLDNNRDISGARMEWRWKF